MRFVILALFLIGCSTSGQKTILLSENDAEEYQKPLHRRLRPYVHFNLYSRKSILIGAHEFPVWLELGRVVRGATYLTPRERAAGSKPRKMWGFKFIVPYKEPVLW